MKNEPSPRPWRAEPSGRVGTDCIFDANGVYVCLVAKCDSELVVKSVNLHEWLVEHNKLNAEKVCELIDERDRLRDIVKRLLAIAEPAVSELKEFDAAILSVGGARVLPVAEKEAVIREARAAIGDGVQ